MTSPSSNAMTATYEQLSAPFSHTFKKPGSNLDYITGEQVTSRLNEVLGWDGWTFRVLEHGYDEGADELWCLGELTVVMPTTTTCITKQQFGSQKPNRYSRGDNAGKVIDFGFDLKGAATDALKKCASLLGVGLYLHEKESAKAPADSIAPAEASPSRTYDADELLSLMGEHGVTKEMLVRITGKSTNGNPQISKWLAMNPGKNVQSLISLAVDAKVTA